MNSKRVQAQMQIDVSFLADTTKLVKQLQDSTNKLNLDAGFTKQFSNNLNKGFKEIFSNLDKMTEGLSKKGLSPKQYTTFFNGMNDKLQESLKLTQNLRKGLEDMFNSAENKQALKDLNTFKKHLEEINKLASAQKGAQTRQNTAISKLKEDTGLDYEVSKKMLNAIQQRKSNKQGLTRNQQDWLSANGLDENSLRRALELLKQINAQTEKINQLNSKGKDLTGQSNLTAGIEQLNKQIEQTKANVIMPEVHKQNMTVLSDIESIDSALQQAGGQTAKGFSDSLAQGTLEAEKLAKASSTIREIFAQFGIALSAATVVRGFQELAKSAFDFYKSLDSALNEIYVVSSLSIENVNKLQTSFINMAKRTGMSIDDVTRSAVLFYQQGLNTDEVLEMTRVTSEFAKVAGIDATDAADKLTAAVNGYCLAAENASEVADKFNKVAAASAADINELSTAFSKAAAQANQAGVSMDNYLAYIATMEEATREAPENIGTSLKTIFSRMQQIKTGENTEDNVDVNAVETALHSVGIALRDTEGQLRDLEEIFDELGPKWNQLDRNTQAYLGTIVAGTRQQSRFITLMQNWNRVQDLADQSANSAGMQALMHAKAMDSIESKLQQFHVAWQEFVSNLASSDLFKGIIESLTKLLKLVNSGNKPMIILSLAIAGIGKKLKELQLPILNKIKDFKNIFTGKSFTSDAEKSAAIEKNKKAQEESEQKVNNLLEYQKSLRQQIEDLERKKLVDGDLDEGNQKQLNGLKEEELNIQREINKEKQNGTKLTEEGKRIQQSEIMSKRQKVGSALSAGGMALSSLGMMSGDANTSGLLGSTGTGLMAVGQGFQGNYIGAAISAVTAGYQLFKTIQDWGKNLEKKITDAVDKVNSGLSKVNNVSTGIKSTEALLKKYNQLSNKVVRTSEEQTELNSLVQELGDTYNIDTLADSYGNLAININEVNDALEEQYAEKERLMKELSAQEVDSLTDSFSDLFNSNKVGDYLDQLFKTTGSSYKSLLKGIDDDLTDETRSISSNMAKAFSSNLKTSMMNELKNNADSYIGQGFANALTGMEEDLQGALKSGDWNELYSEIDFLKNNIENMSFDDVQSHLQNFYDNWDASNKLTQEQWDLLVDSINNTVFENSSLLEFYGKVNEMQSKVNGSYYDKRISKLNEQIDKYDKASKGADIGGAAAGTLGTTAVATAAFGAANGWNPVGWVSLGVAGLLGIGGAIASYNSEDNKKQRALEKRKKELEKEKKKVLEDLVKENALLADTKDAEKWVDAQSEVAKTMQGLTSTTQAYIANMNSLYDFSNMTAEGAEEYSKTLKTALKGLEGLDTEGDKYNYLADYYRDHQSEMSDEVREQWQTILDEAFNSLALTSTKTFTQIGTELDSISKRLRSMNSIVKEFNDEGAISLDTFMDLADILDNMDIEALGKMDGGTEYIDNMIDALHNLDLAYDANNGMITMNGDALNNLRTIQEAQTKAKIASMIADLKASKASTETEIAYIDAQIEGARAVLTTLEGKGNGQVKYAEVTEKANQAVEASMNESLSNILTNYQNDVNNNNTWKTTIIDNLADVSKAWNAYYTAVRNGTANVDELYNTAMSKTKGSWSGFDSNSGIDWGKYTRGSGADKVISDVSGLRAQLNDYITKLENTKAKYYKTLEVTNAEIGMLESLYNSDLSKLGAGKDSGSSKEDRIKTYIGQLKEIYNILNRIAMLEHRLSTLDTYAEVSQGEKYGELLQERLSYNEELMNQYEFLVSEQKQFTNGYKDFINSVDGLQGVFDFDKYGQIIINWEKYINLQDQAADGEVTLKQKADDVYNTYTEMFKELQDDFDKYIAYLKKVIDLQQEMVDKYVDMENKAANAVKEIYQKILDTKLEAIDKEKEAIQDLREAREQARKDQENAETVSDLQTNLQRAMMDTSGASDIAFIKAQKDINDKLEDIAEDKYSKMLDDITNKLDEEQEALREEFDELWENMDWLFAWLDEEVMRDDERLKELLIQTEEWNTSSELQRRQLADEWNTNYQTYMSGLKNGKTIFDVYENIGETRNQIAKLDTSLVNEMSKNSKEIIQTIKSWQSDVNSTISSAVNNAVSRVSSSYNSGNNGPKVTNYNTPTNPTSTTITITLDDGYKSCSQKTVKKGESVTLPALSRSGYKFTGWDIPSLGICTMGSYTYKPTRNETVKAMWSATSSKKVSAYTPAFIPKNNYSLTLPTVPRYARGGLATQTGPAWLDGTVKQPEAVLNALQTEHFIKFTNALDNLYGNGNQTTNTSSVNIENIEFKVNSMSSPEDGEKAFNVFVNKFKEIGNQTGIKINSFKNTL